jgi:DNA repair protein RadC
MSAPATSASSPIPLTVTVLADAAEPVGGAREAATEEEDPGDCGCRTQVQAQIRPMADAAAPIPAGLHEASEASAGPRRVPPVMASAGLVPTKNDAYSQAMQRGLGTVGHNRHFTARELAEYLQISSNQVRSWLNTLTRSGYVGLDDDGYFVTRLGWTWIEGAAQMSEAGSAPGIDSAGGYAHVQRMLEFFVKHQGLGQYVPNTAIPTGQVTASGSGVWAFYTRLDERSAPQRREVDDTYLRQVYTRRGANEAGEAGEAGEDVIHEATEYGVSWQQRRDGVWMARGTGGIYYMLPTPSGMYQTIWMSDTGANQQDLGMHTFASGAQAVSRYVPDVGRMRQIAPERAAEAGEAMELQWERSGGGTGWRGEGRAGTYLLRHVLGKTTGTDDTGWWNLHVSGRQYGPYPSLDAAKRAAAHMDGFAGEAAAPSVQAQAPSGTDYDVSYYDPKIKQWRSKTVMLSVAPGDVHREAARVLGMDAGSIVVVAARSYLAGAGELAARADWDIHIVDPRTRKVRTERLNVPGTDASMGDTNAAAYVASKKFKVDQRYILALPHRERSEFAAEQAPYVEQGQVCRPWVRMEKDPLAFNACMKLADKVGPIEGHDRLHEILRQYMERQDQEVLVAIVLGTHLELRAMSEISRGGRDRVPTPMPDIARLAAYQAVHYGGMALGIAHTHPSGKPRPSQADREVTRAVEDVCAALGILFVDHLVIGSIEHGYYSFKSGKIHRPRRAR